MTRALGIDAFRDMSIAKQGPINGIFVHCPRAEPAFAAGQRAANSESGHQP
jgi:hypothetical protein